MGNDRLRSAVARKMRSTRDLSEAIGVDPKTIERWLSGRTPHLRHREALARHLEVRMALGHYQPLLVEHDNAVRLHATTLYNSIFRFDDDMLVNTHAWGSNAYKSPVLHLHQVSGGSMFDTYATSFDSVWRTATIYEG